jgi:predicted metal-dependent phosphoesterase TrpH
MKIDLHLHTAERSGCAMSSAVDQLAAARAAGLGAVAITDHHALTTPADRAVWHDLFPDLLVLPGIEITLDEEYEDILVIGLDEPELARGSWIWSDLRSFVQERGGFTILAHPMRFTTEIGIDLENEPPDAIEGWSTNVSARTGARVRSIASMFGLPVVANSDAHWTADVGRYANVLHEPAGSVAEVLKAMREGRFDPEVRDPRR